MDVDNRREPFDVDRYLKGEIPFPPQGSSIPLEEMERRGPYRNAVIDVTLDNVADSYTG